MIILSFSTLNIINIIQYIIYAKVIRFSELKKCDRFPKALLKTAPQIPCVSGTNGTVM